MIQISEITEHKTLDPAKFPHDSTSWLLVRPASRSCHEDLAIHPPARHHFDSITTSRAGTYTSANKDTTWSSQTPAQPDLGIANPINVVRAQAAKRT